MSAINQTLMLAVFGREQVPRSAPPEDWKWTRAWARRWWVVESPDLKSARLLIQAADELQVSDVPGFGRIVDCGRNGPGIGREAAPSARKPGQSLYDPRRRTSLRREVSS